MDNINNTIAAIDVEQRIKKAQGVSTNHKPFQVMSYLPETAEPEKVYREVVRIVADRYTVFPTYRDRILILEVIPHTT